MKTVLITGAEGGIGKAAERLFRSEGWNVIGVDKKGGTYKIDISCADHIFWLASEVKGKYGKINAVVNNASIMNTRPLTLVTPTDFEIVMNNNLRSAFCMTTAFQPLLWKGGAIVNVSSIHAIAGSKNCSVYAASKAGLLSLTRSAAIEFAPDIRVNAVLPGATDTHMLKAGLERDGSTKEEKGKRMLMQRVGEPEEIAQAILFLADGERSSFITGQALIVDGGTLCRLSTWSRDDIVS